MQAMDWHLDPPIRGVVNVPAAPDTPRRMVSVLMGPFAPGATG